LKRFEWISVMSRLPNGDDEQGIPLFTDWIPIQSRALLAARYSFAGRLLQIAFRTGRFYQYEGVPSGVFDALMAADSKGTYFNQNIRDRFPFIEMSDPGLTLTASS
jgi:hypothetical protein